MDGTVLIADDDRSIRTVLTHAFTRAGCKVHATSSIATLLRWVQEGKGDLIVSDVMMPDGNGLEALPKILALRPSLPVIIISAQNNIMTAVNALESDAYDYLPKPFDLPDLIRKSAKALDGNSNPKDVLDGSHAIDSDLPLVGQSIVMQGLYRIVAQVKNLDISVLIQGESGTGKSLFARMIHDLSDRKGKPFIILNTCNEDDFQDIVAQAYGGTLVLDEVSDFSNKMQSQLARQLDMFGSRAPRIISTTQYSLSLKVQTGDFRSDLYYRISGMELKVPALCHRKEDIPLLAHYFLQKIRNTNSNPKTLSRNALDLLCDYDWHGNVRQLENLMNRLALCVPQSLISEEDIKAILGPKKQSKVNLQCHQNFDLSQSITQYLKGYFLEYSDKLPPTGLYTRILQDVERPLIDISLSATRGNQAKCAELLGINRNTLRKKISDLDITVTHRKNMM